MSDDFRELPDRELALLSDEELLAHIDAARDAQVDDCAMRAVAMLIFRHLDWVRARVRRSVPEHLVDDLTQDAMIEALGSAFAGTTIKEFAKWLGTITQRYIATFYRGKQGKQFEAERHGRRLDDRDPEDDRPAPDVADEEDGFAGVELGDVVERLLAARSDAHRRVIERYVFHGYDAKETARRTGETEANVYQVAKRFRDDLRAALVRDEGDTGAQA